MAWLIPSAQVAGGPLLELSPQQLLTCTPNPQHCGGEGGCEGATQALAFNYTRRISAASGGIKLSSAYGYKPEQARDTTAPALLPRCVPLSQAAHHRPHRSLCTQPSARAPPRVTALALLGAGRAVQPAAEGGQPAPRYPRLCRAAHQRLWRAHARARAARADRHLRRRLVGPLRGRRLRCGRQEGARHALRAPAPPPTSTSSALLPTKTLSAANYHRVRLGLGMRGVCARSRPLRPRQVCNESIIDHAVQLVGYGEEQGELAH